MVTQTLSVIKTYSVFRGGEKKKLRENRLNYCTVQSNMYVQFIIGLFRIEKSRNKMKKVKKMCLVFREFSIENKAKCSRFRKSVR